MSHRQASYAYPPPRAGTGSRVALRVAPDVRPRLSVPLRRRLARRGRRMLHAAGLCHVELSLLLTGDDEMASLNAAYRRRTGPTDVLSFALVEDLDLLLSWRYPAEPHASDLDRVLGDIVIDVPLVARRSAPLVAFEADLVDLVAHGVLHLLGHDHPSPARRRAMLALQARLVAEACARGPVRPVVGALDARAGSLSAPCGRAPSSL